MQARPAFIVLPATCAAAQTPAFQGPAAAQVPARHRDSRRRRRQPEPGLARPGVGYGAEGRCGDLGNRRPGLLSVRGGRPGAIVREYRQRATASVQRLLPQGLLRAEVVGRASWPVPASEGVNVWPGDTIPDQQSHFRNSRRTGLNGHARASSQMAVGPFRLVVRNDSGQDKTESRLQDERRGDDFNENEFRTLCTSSGGSGRCWYQWMHGTGCGRSIFPGPRPETRPETREGLFAKQDIPARCARRQRRPCAQPGPQQEEALQERRRSEGV
jgi:hypothetical protein